MPLQTLRCIGHDPAKKNAHGAEVGREGRNEGEIQMISVSDRGKQAVHVVWTPHLGDPVLVKISAAQEDPRGSHEGWT